MKKRTEANGSTNDDWETPDFIKDWVRHHFGEFYDPCPLKSSFDGLALENWGAVNYINPPYSKDLKTAFIEKAILEADKGYTCVLLIPATTETKSFLKLWKRASEVYFIHSRVAFKGFNTKGVYVTNKCGQGGSALIVLKAKSPITVPKVDILFQEDMKVQ